MRTQQLFNEILRSADLLAAAVVKRMRPSDDLLTQRQAFKEFDRGWIKANTYPRGELRPIRTGTAPNSPLKYSRTEILALQEVERQQLREVQEII